MKPKASESTPRSRRAVLVAAAGAAAATAAATLGRPLAAAAADGGPLILGESNSATIPTELDGPLFVHGEAGSVEDPSHIALHGSSLHGTGVVGESTGQWGPMTAGVRGIANELSSVAVAAIGQVGGGTGLWVQGKVRLTSRSGRAYVPAGKSFVDVDLRPGTLTGLPLCFAILNSYRPGVFVASVRAGIPSADRMRIYLNKAVASRTPVAWFVLN